MASKRASVVIFLKISQYVKAHAKLHLVSVFLCSKSVDQDKSSLEH